MREHQIVINLKRDQFEEVQRLARLAGSKSVSAYLRERVLKLIEQSGTETQTSSATTEDMLLINSELSRMHRELQVFIAESLSSSTFSGEDELENEFEPDPISQTYMAFQEMERNMEAEIERLKALPDQAPTAITRMQQSETLNNTPVDPYVNNTPVDPYAMYGAQAFKRSDTPRPANHRNQSPGSARRSGQAEQRNQPLDQLEYPPLAQGQSQPEQPAQTGRASAGEQTAHDSQTSTERAAEPTGAGSWSGFPVTSHIESAGIYTNVSTESIWLTPPQQAISPAFSLTNESVDRSTRTDNQAEQQPPRDTTSGAKPERSLSPPGGAGSISNTRTNATYSSHDTAGSTVPPSDIQNKSQFTQPNDELEDLAERAFAISPRLGTFSGSSSTPAGIRKRQIEDPLEDLLDDSIMEQAQRQRMTNSEESSPYEDGVVYAFGGPEPVPEPDPAPVYAGDTLADDTTGATTQDETIGQNLQTVSDPNMQSANQIPSTSSSADESTHIQDDQPSMITADSTGHAPVETEDLSASQAPSPDPSMLGGPPPKRKRTLDDLTSGDDDERLSGGPPPKRRKK
jgi:hypothetical protein